MFPIFARMPHMARIKPWRISRGPLIALAVLLMAAIFVLRLAVDDPAEPITYLMVIPIGLLAAEIGIPGGLAAATLASVLVIVWDVIVQPNLTPLGFSLRFVVFLITGLSVGLMAHSRKEIEGEASRWFDESPDLNCVSDFDGNFVRVNQAFEQTLGHQVAEFLNSSYASYVHPDDVVATSRVSRQLAEDEVKVAGFANRFRAADGSYRWLRWTATSDHARGLVYATARDITQTKELEAQLRELAQTDSLTGLSNRRYFESEAKRQLDFLRRYGPGGGLFILDIDRFKTINDTFGHGAGDEALKTVARVMNDCIRTSDACARVGGDEFAILLPGVGRKEAELLAMGLLGSIREQSLSNDGATISITVSVGVALFRHLDADDLDALVAAADRAMYDAKRGGGDHFAFAPDNEILAPSHSITRLRRGRETRR